MVHQISPSRIINEIVLACRLAHQEEQDALAEFGEKYIRYAEMTPAFFPWGRRTQKKLSHSHESHHDP